MLKRTVTKAYNFSSSCKHYINGKWVKGADKNPMKILNPVGTSKTGHTRSRQ
jgi:hypothetical protein